MSEPIDWKALHPWQRDQLIAEKIMGVTDFRCTFKLSYDGNNTLYRYHYYVCISCGARVTITSHSLKGREAPDEHTRPTPPYSTSMDAAWLLVKHFSDSNEGDPTSVWTYSQRFLSHIASMYDNCSDHYGSNEAIFALDDLAALTPERICIEALRAVGLDVMV